MMLLVVSRLEATMIFVLTLPDGIWIGADSFRGPGLAPPQSLVCKIHVKWDGVLLKTGLEYGTNFNGTYSVDREVDEALSAATSWDDFKSKSQNLLEEEVREAIPTYPSRVDEKTVRRIIDIETRELIIIRFVKSEPIIELLKISPKESRGLFLLNEYSVENNGGWQLQPNSTYHGYPSLPPLLNYYSAEQIQRNPVQALKDNLADVHRHKPCAVGSPFAIAHFYLVQASTKIEKRHFRRDEVTVIPAKTQFDWIEQGVCPSWAPRDLTENQLSEIASCDLVPWR
jgi:hypothetical protein